MAQRKKLQRVQFGPAAHVQDRTRLHPVVDDRSWIYCCHAKRLRKDLTRRTAAQLALGSIFANYAAAPGGTCLAFAADALANPFARERRPTDKTQPGLGLRLVICVGLLVLVLHLVDRGGACAFRQRLCKSNC